MPKEDLKIKEELAAIRKQEEINKIQAYRDEIRGDRYSKAMADLEGDALTGDPQHPNQTYWKAANEQARQVINSDVAAYNDWRYAMNALLKLFFNTNQALNHEVNKLVTKAFHHLPFVGGYYLVDKVSALFDKEGNIDLPELQHQVSMNDEGELQIQPLLRSDEVAMAENGQNTLDDLFAKGIHNWLKDQGYEMEGNRCKKIGTVDTYLNKAEFDDLKDKSETGLASYLNQDPELKFSPRP